MEDLEDLGRYLHEHPRHHRQIIQNFLNMVIMETRGSLKSDEDLENLLDIYFTEGDEIV